MRAWNELSASHATAVGAQSGGATTCAHTTSAPLECFAIVLRDPVCADANGYTRSAADVASRNIAAVAAFGAPWAAARAPCCAGAEPLLLRLREGVMSERSTAMLPRRKSALLSWRAGSGSGATGSPPSSEELADLQTWWRLSRGIGHRCVWFVGGQMRRESAVATRAYPAVECPSPRGLPASESLAPGMKDMRRRGLPPPPPPVPAAGVAAAAGAAAPVAP